MSNLPTFLIPGSGKSGSTSLWNYLKQHPEVCMARQKEPLFFTRVTGRQDGGRLAPARSGRYQRGLEWYQSLFEHCGDAPARGEASAYLYLEDSAGLIEKHIPDVKLVFLLRDPVDRLRSHYYQVRSGGEDLTEPFGRFVEEQPPYFEVFCDVSSYKKHLERFYERFPEENIGLFFLEDLRDNPRATVQSIQRFIGVDPEFVPPNLGERYNRAEEPRSMYFKKMVRWLRNHSGLRELVPGKLRSLGRKLLMAFDRLNKVKMDYEEMSPEVRKQLIDRFQEDISFVERKADRDLSAWRQV